MAFTDNLQALMSAKGISRRKLAKECGISPSAVNSWFNRSAENISLQTLKKLSDYFGISIEESEERHEKAVPILTRVVEEMHTLEPKEQNDLLKMIIDRIEYEKTESGAAIEPTLRISLKI